VAEKTIPTFEEWVRFLFDHKPAQPGEDKWYFTNEIDEWYSRWDEEIDPQTTVHYITRLFENIAEISKPFSDAQLNEGLWYLINETRPHMYAVNDSSVPWPLKQRCIQSVYVVFEQLFAPRCTPHLGHLQRSGYPSDMNTLHSICYMWWDIFPLYPMPEDPSRRELDSEILSVMEQELALDSIACQEGALHGLGHWQHYLYPESRAIIDRYLEANPDLLPELRDYALRARDSGVP
jgi:hypothetical protein